MQLQNRVTRRRYDEDLREPPHARVKEEATMSEDGEQCWRRPREAPVWKGQAALVHGPRPTRHGQMQARCMT